MVLMQYSNCESVSNDHDDDMAGMTHELVDDLG